MSDLMLTIIQQQRRGSLLMKSEAFVKVKPWQQASNCHTPIWHLPLPFLAVITVSVLQKSEHMIFKTMNGMFYANIHEILNPTVMLKSSYQILINYFY